LPSNGNTGDEGVATDNKVISLRGHRDAEDLLDGLVRADRQSPGYPLLLSRALALGQPLLAAITRRLDATRPFELRRLGDLTARFPSRITAVQMLVRAASDRRSADRRRMGAIMLLCSQYLSAPPSDDLIFSLRDPAESLANALVALLESCGDEPSLLAEFAEYFRVLLGQPPDILYSAVGKLTGPREHAVAVLRLLALHPHPDIADASIEALAGDPSPEAARTLAMLEPNLHVEAARVVARSIQKLRLSGSSIATLAPPGPGCRALLSAIDGWGRRLLWLRVEQPETGSLLLGLLLRDDTGLMEATAATGSLLARFPGEARIGAQHAPFVYRPLDAEPNYATATCIEVPFAYALRVLRDEVRKNGATSTPLPLDYQLLFHHVWRFSGDFESGQNQIISQDEAGEPADVEHESELLSNQLFEGWYISSDGTQAVAEEVAELDKEMPHELSHDNWRVLLPALIRLAHDEFGPELRGEYSRRLHLMAEWLWIAGQHREATLAASASRTMQQSPPEANLFVLRLIQRGVLVGLSRMG
jgi:hypothetical protein